MIPQAKIHTFTIKNSNIIIKGSFEKDIIFQEKNLKHRKIMYLTNFIFARTFFLIAPYQIFKNDVILINHGSFLQGKDFLQLERFQFSKMNQIPNSAICL